MPKCLLAWQQARMDLKTATLHHKWAVAEAKRGGTTPALAKFIKETCKECRIQTARLKELAAPAKRPNTSN
jgi:hypothetical protein